MNETKVSGKLTKAPYFSDKGWASCTLAIPKEGTNFSLWVPVYVPAKLAPQLKNLMLTDVVEVVGELDQTKDKKLQIKALGISVKKGAAPVARKWDEGTEITDADIPW